MLFEGLIGVKNEHLIDSIYFMYIFYDVNLL